MSKNSADKISREFARHVRGRLKNHLINIILFGSRARGDFKEGSDYDILVVVDKRKKTFENFLLNLSVDFLNKYNVLIGDIVCDENEWEKKNASLSALTS